MDSADRVRKLRWMCRRGMKELDILLERFVDSRQASLERGEWRSLEILLAREDDVLWDLLQDPGLENDAAIRKILYAIRDDDARTH